MSLPSSTDLVEAAKDAVAAATQNRASFLEDLPLELQNDEGMLPAQVRALNASIASKFRKVYAVIDAIADHRAPFVACREGCAHCCKMEVSISAAEARVISAATGRPLKRVLDRVTQGHGKYVGVACPFLATDHTCSIYTVRPMVCRKHASFFNTSRWCEADTMNFVDAPMVNFSGIDEAYLSIGVSSGQTVIADIRDFFD